MNGVAMARHGLIFGEDGATGSRKVSRYLRDLRDTIKTSKIPIPPKIPKFEFQKV